MAAELVAAHDADAVRGKVEVYDWLVKRGDKRIGKNPVRLPRRLDPRRLRPARRLHPPRRGRPPRRRRAPGRRGRAPPPRPRARRAERAARKDADLKAKWAALDDSERDSIASQVKAENPGLRRWKTMMEPLCLAELERRLCRRIAASERPVPGDAVPGGEAGEVRDCGPRRHSGSGGSGSTGSRRSRAARSHLALIAA